MLEGNEVRVVLFDKTKELIVRDLLPVASFRLRRPRNHGLRRAVQESVETGGQRSATVFEGAQTIFQPADFDLQANHGGMVVRAGSEFLRRDAFEAQEEVNILSGHFSTSCKKVVVRIDSTQLNVQDELRCQ